MKEIKQLTFEKACKLEGLDSKKVTAASLALAKLFPKKDQKSMAAQSKLVIMIKAANRLANDGKEWRPVFGDGQWKYEPRFDMTGGSSRFRSNGYAYWLSYSYVGSRLCFKNYDVMKWMEVDNKNFKKLRKEYMV